MPKIIYDSFATLFWMLILTFSIILDLLVAIYVVKTVHKPQPNGIKVQKIGYHIVGSCCGQKYCKNKNFHYNN